MPHHYGSLDAPGNHESRCTGLLSEQLCSYDVRASNEGSLEMGLTWQRQRQAYRILHGSRWPPLRARPLVTSSRHCRTVN